MGTNLIHVFLRIKQNKNYLMERIDAITCGFFLLLLLQKVQSKYTPNYNEMNFITGFQEEVTKSNTNSFFLSNIYYRSFFPVIIAMTNSIFLSPNQFFLSFFIKIGQTK